MLDDTPRERSELIELGVVRQRDRTSETLLRSGPQSAERDRQARSLCCPARARSAPEDSVFLPHSQTKSVSALSVVQTEPALR
jgi:hypothetical protein